ncbi:hypothetical protein M758_4G061800 [Ceratodon purpureus]|nr:hypothetical protein M758_4G061800 [Ceratodon purpureus]
MCFSFSWRSCSWRCRLWILEYSGFRRDESDEAPKDHLENLNSELAGREAYGSLLELLLLLLLLRRNVRHLELQRTQLPPPHHTPRTHHSPGFHSSFPRSPTPSRPRNGCLPGASRQGEGWSVGRVVEDVERGRVLVVAIVLEFESFLAWRGFSIASMRG